MKLNSIDYFNDFEWHIGTNSNFLLIILVITRKRQFLHRAYYRDIITGHLSSSGR